MSFCSRKAVLEERNADRKGSTLGQIEEDIIVEGQIKILQTMARSWIWADRWVAARNRHVVGTTAESG